MPQKPYATFSLMGLNVVVFLLASRVLPAGNFLLEQFPLFFPFNQEFHSWQFLTHMFMHGSLTHLFMNMFGLYSFGAVLERVWGPTRFLIFYFAAGLGAGAIYTAVDYVEYNHSSTYLVEQGVPQATMDQLKTLPTNGAINQVMAAPSSLSLESKEAELESMFGIYFGRVVGASGAIYGILTAFGVLFPNVKLSLIFLPIPVPAKYFIPGILLLDLFSGITGFSLFSGGSGGIAHFAHLGGALIGFLLMLLWKNKMKSPQMRAVA
ncbi:rhomboid family intramembrane serine protease [Kiritimatiellota bacterium B12222]|nr:rhomboid family intramembrane serine protease [Kiritimatiellota bacterium B12222]